MFRRLFGKKSGGSAAGAQSEIDAVADSGTPAPPRPRSSGAFANLQKLPSRTVIVVLPANHSVPFERIAVRAVHDGGQELEMIVACAGQPAHATVTAIHARLPTAQFLLAPAQMGALDLRALAIARATGDIVTIIDGIPDAGAERTTRGARASGTSEPPLSVIMPAHNEAAVLEEALSAINASDLPRDFFEVIVVDDASTDSSVMIAARYADTIIRLKAQARGAAYARNRGADQARGGVLAFVDADVRLRADTFSKMITALTANAHAAAVGASSDGTSGDGGVPTQYWNLLQQFGAKKYTGTGIYFAATCGAVRRDAFVEAGMFNEWRYRDASVEDLDLGMRLQRAGHEVLLRQDVTVSHLRSHSLGGVLASVWSRSTLLTRTLSYRVTRPLGRADVVHTLDSAVGFGAAGVAVLLVVTLLDPLPALVALSGIGVVFLLAANFDLLRFFVRRRGLIFAMAALPLHLTAQIVATAGRCNGLLLRNIVGDPTPDATTQAFAEVGVDIWPPVPRKL